MIYLFTEVKIGNLWMDQLVQTCRCKIYQRCLMSIILLCLKQISGIIPSKSFIQFARVVPFLDHSEQHRYAKRTVFYRAWERIKDLVAAEIKHRVNQLTIMGVLPSAMTRYFNLITQQYSGHVTIWPDFTINDLLTILDGPTTEMLRNCIIEGSRRVYPSNPY